MYSIVGIAALILVSSVILPSLSGTLKSTRRSTLFPVKSRSSIVLTGMVPLFHQLLREIDVHLHDGLDVVSACRKAGVSDKTYYYWRKKFGGMGRSQLSEMRALQKENERLKKIVADLQLDKLILKESLDYLKPKA